MIAVDEALAQRLDRNYRWQRHVYDLTREHYLVGRDTLIAGLLPPERGSVLEIGCGTARNLMSAAERYPLASCYGLDLSRAMLETARAGLASHPCNARIRLVLADGTSFDPRALFGCDRFDRIFFAYSLSMIPAWQKALRHAALHLAPGGSLHVVDFGTGDGLPRLANTALRCWLARFHVAPRDDLVRVLAGLAADQNGELFSTPIARTYTTYAVLTLRR